MVTWVKGSATGISNTTKLPDASVVARLEPMPVTRMEAFAMALPVCASRTEPTRVVVGDWALVEMDNTRKRIPTTPNVTSLM